MQYLSAISKWQNDLCSFPKQNIPYHSNLICVPTPMPKKLKLNGSMNLQDLLEITPQKDIIFIIGGLNAKVGSQEIPGITEASLALEYRMKQGKG